MPRHPVTLVESSAQGAVAFISEATITVTDALTGKLLATTQEAQASSAGVQHIPSVPSASTIRAAAFSPTGRYLAVCTNDKALVVYDTATWTVQRQLVSDKRTNALAFDPQETHVLAGDKFGDCTRISICSDEDPSSEVILGHVSILCALAFTPTTPPLLLSCDRDEKLRISHYPNAYNIQAFGLGHTEFVTSVAALKCAPQVCLTGSGDGTMRLWNTEDGTLLQTVDLAALLQGYYRDGRVKCAEANSFEDRNAKDERYGVLRVSAAEGLRAYIAVVERFPVVLVLPIMEDGGSCSGKRGLGQPLVVDVERPPTDVAPTAAGFIVAYAAGPRLADAYVGDAQGGFVRDAEASEGIAQSVRTRESAEEVIVPSIFVWGNKMYIERPAGENNGGGDDEE
ncbi:WD repeat-containing protein 4 [Coemansia erecta]|uniref:WD repeat-containing protein 4 n=1 Tax=Coemansia erecta TaxID=147472 RepID=A0A9W7Y406_9FUNG|nr:WD repeat-containing protein 4 [Coemansia erecta]